MAACLSCLANEQHHIGTSPMQACVYCGVCCVQASSARRQIHCYAVARHRFCLWSTGQLPDSDRSAASGMLWQWATRTLCVMHAASVESGTTLEPAAASISAMLYFVPAWGMLLQLRAHMSLLFSVSELYVSQSEPFFKCKFLNRLSILLICRSCQVPMRLAGRA